MILCGDALEQLQSLPDNSIQCCVTSPPYWNLRDYGVSGQIGMESTPETYIARLVEVFNEVKRVLRDDGVLWLNMGDSYAGSGKGLNRDGTSHGTDGAKQKTNTGSINVQSVDLMGYKPKDLIGIPWMLAFALRADGWYLRQDIIWSKTACMPESVQDRCTRSHEYIFLFSKNRKYFYNADAIAEPAIYFDDDRKGRAKENHKSSPTEQRNGILPQKIPSGWDTSSGSHNKLVGKYEQDKQRGHGRRHAGFNDRWDAMEKKEQCSGMRNKRDVWTIGPDPFPEAHFATFPEELPTLCILAGSKEGDVILDPFAGAGTTLLAALKLQRSAIGIELKPEYVEMIKKRLWTEIPMLAQGIGG